MKHEHKSCYGTMFPDPLHVETNREMQGKVFSLEVDTFGLARADAMVKSNLSQWDDCLGCPEFEHCYKFCMAKLALSATIAKN